MEKYSAARDKKGALCGFRLRFAAFLHKLGRIMAHLINSGELQKLSNALS